MQGPPLPPQGGHFLMLWGGLTNQKSPFLHHLPSKKNLEHQGLYTSSRAAAVVGGGLYTPGAAQDWLGTWVAARDWLAAETGGSTGLAGKRATWQHGIGQKCRWQSGIG